MCWRWKTFWDTMRSMTPKGADGRAVASISTDPPNVENDKVMVPAALVLDGASAAFTAKSQDDLRNTAPYSAILSHVGCQFMPVVCVVCPWDIATCTTKIQHFAPRHVGTWPSPLGSDSQPQPARGSYHSRSPGCMSQVHPSSTEEFTKVDHCY